MKFLKITISLLLTAQLCQAQDTTIVLSASRLDKFTDQIMLGELNGWIFKQGTDTGLAKLNIDTSGWRRLRPDQLSSKYADQNGRVEGWFRLKVKFDTSLFNKIIYFDFGKWAAMEFYIDGEPIATRGNTGEYGKTFREYNGGLDPVSMRFNSPAPHIFNIHFAGYLSPVPPYDLKAQTQLNKILNLGGPDYISNSLKKTITDNTFNSLWLTVCGILSVLFWLLLVQNPQEKNLFWIALYASSFTIFIYCLSNNAGIGTTYIEHETYNIIAVLFLLGAILLLLPVLLIKVFKRKINSKLILTLSILYVLSVLRNYFPKSFSLIGQLDNWGPFIFIFCLCLYYVITSWRKLRGAQWAIVAGLIFPFFSLLVIVLLALIFKFTDSPFLGRTFSSIFFLSFPLSLLIYVSMRFKEIIKEVQANAEKVVELSEEKKVQAENQQKVLEAEVARQTGEIRQTLENLKSTQSQLIQSEKMASLGELTAGIAHEIQNPLNFVNNFSEVNKEMLADMREEIEKKNFDDVSSIAKDVEENEEKIIFHGKRADAIVKGMLQHSRSSSGVKEPANINALADEYLRLAYHGLRAKDKSFNATMKTDFDETIGNINIIPQDIGRVVLNLINNAFYVVDEKKKSGIENYEPTVSISTKKIADNVILTVKDNGNGIPQKVVDKIFQPFFTTKPTGQGTGLGLSLSYDIVKAHGGEIKVDTKEGEGTTFIISLPENNQV